jgi:hypothetical protein
MNANKVEGRTQMELPGMDKVRHQDHERRMKDLIERFPKPETKEMAELFFRNLEKDKKIEWSIVATVRLRKDHDLLRLVFKTKNAEAEDRKFESITELSIDNPEDYEEKYVKAATEAYDMWLRYETDKN